MASIMRNAARVARPVVRQTSRRYGQAVESTAPEAALQPKKTYTSGDQKLMDAKYTEDIGYMFGEKPPPEGVARIRQSWELPYVTAMTTAAVMIAVGLTFKPDTTIATWAKTEAIRRKKAGEI